jgi:hypothetical protein
MLAMQCAQVGIIEDINHEVFCSLLENQNSCALHLKVTLSGLLLYDLLYNMLEGGFPDEEICCFFGIYGFPLLPPFLGTSGEAFSWRLPFVRMLVQPLWLNEDVEVLPQ